MAQEIRTTNKLIINALYLHGELAVNETPDQFMLDTGLDIINEILGKLSSDSIYIPFLTTLSGTFEYGKSTYSVSDMISDADIKANRIVDLIYVEYNVPASDGTTLTTVTYPVTIISQNQFYNSIRQSPTNSRPGAVYFENTPSETLITFYPAPSDAYSFKLKVRAMISSLEAQSTLEELPPLFYGFLKYALARSFLGYYPSNNWTENKEKEYEDYYNILKNTSGVDMSITTSTLLQTTQPFFWTNIVSY